MATPSTTSAGASHPDPLNDPEGEVWLETEDKELLRVRAYVLQAHSIVFRDMLAMPESGPSTQENPIPISATEEEFRALIAFATEYNVEQWTDWPIMGRVYELAEIYDFPAVRGRLVDHICVNADIDPWESFVFAAQKNLEDIAEQAIRHMYSEDDVRVRSSITLPADQAARVPAAYLVPYILLLPEGEEDTAFWAKAAETFQPRFW